MSECPRCLGTGWEDCSSDPYCTEDGHGGYCSCLAGVERRQDDEAEDQR